MTPNLNKALSQAQGEFKTITFNATAKVQMKAGGSYEFSYADLGHVIDCTRPALVKYGLSLSSRIEAGSMFVDLRHESGEMISSSLPIRLTERPQDLGSLITYYRRYLICGLLGVTAEDDDDAGAASGDETIVEKKAGPKKEPNLLQKFVVKFGPDKGKTFEELGVGEVSRKIGQLKFSKADFAKTKMAKDFIKEAEEWLKIGSGEDLDKALAGSKPNQGDIAPPDDWANEPPPEWSER